MGLLDDLKRTALNNVVRSVEKSIGNAVGSSIKSAAKAVSQNGSQKPAATPAPAAAPAAPASYTASGRYIPPTPEETAAKFDQILATDFSELKVIRNAEPGSVGIPASGDCRPYSYVLQRGGKNVAIVMLTPYGKHRFKVYNNSKKSALDAKIPFLNFFTHFYNDRDYVVNRIKKNI